ncbi:MAG: phospholipase D-like domain-containing protein, partial [Planctomycetota bacterium]
HWPRAARLPAIYYDPRALRLEMNERASLHAKAIIVDGHQVFITSANFTEAAQERNIEVGLKLEDTVLATQLTRHFQGLRDAGVLKRVI